MRVEIRNRTGLTIVTSATATSGSVAIGDRPVEMDADAWAHTLACSKSLARLVGDGDGKIEVREVALKSGPSISMTVEIGDPDAVVVAMAPAVEAELAKLAEALNPPPAPMQPRQQRGGKRGR